MDISLTPRNKMADTDGLADPDASKEAAITAPTGQPPSSGTSTKKRRSREKKHHILSKFTIRNPPWSYLHLQHLSPAPLSSSSSETLHSLDAVTAHLHIAAALTQFLGLHGAAVQFDILKLEARDVWIRLNADAESAVLAALGGWVSSKGEGWRVRGRSSWDARALGRGGGQDLFDGD